MARRRRYSGRSSGSRRYSQRSAPRRSYSSGRRSYGSRSRRYSARGGGMQRLQIQLVGAQPAGPTGQGFGGRLPLTPGAIHPALQQAGVPPKSQF